MDILAYAIEMEKDGEAYYRQLAHRTGNPGLQTILTMLADEEVLHQQVVTRMRGGRAQVPAGEVLMRAKNIFTEMKDSEQALPDDTSQTDLYKKALDIEHKSEQFYASQARQDKAPQVAVFEALAAEEHKHAVLVENLIEFVSRPQTWLENAEFYHLEEY